MSSIQNFSLRAPSSRSARSNVLRLTIAVASFGSALFSSAARAQSAADNPDRWEFRASSGALVPTGSARNALKDAALSTAQLSYVVRPSLAITGTFGWARSRDRLSEARAKVDAFMYDVGAELRLAPLFANTPWTLAPFVGAGAGAQSFNYRSLRMDATHNAAGYAAIGGETGVRRVRLRLEVRDYAAGFKPLSGVGESRTHNDVVFMAAVRITKGSSR